MAKIFCSCRDIRNVHLKDVPNRQYFMNNSTATHRDVNRTTGVDRYILCLYNTKNSKLIC